MIITYGSDQPVFATQLYKTQRATVFLLTGFLHAIRNIPQNITGRQIRGSGSSYCT